MKRLLALLVMTTPVLADPPPEQLLEEITDLRGDLGGAISDRADFADALRRVADDEQGREGHAVVADGVAGNGFAQAGWDAPRPSRPGSSERSEPIRGRRPGRPRIAPPERAHGHGYAPGPPRHPGEFGPPPRPERSTKVQLREAAFELDRIAHGLEMAELVEEADALREAAKKLRKSARKSGDDRRDGKTDARARQDAQSKADRHAVREQEFRQRVEVMKKRFAEQKRELEEARRATKAAMEDLAQRVRTKERKERSDREKRTERRKRRERNGAKSPKAAEVEGLFKESRPGTLVPPKGVHGGPTEPPKPHNE